MTLIYCSECENIVSNNSKTCPKCGHSFPSDPKADAYFGESPLPKAQSGYRSLICFFGSLVVLFILLLATGIFSSTDSPQVEKTEKAEKVETNFSLAFSGDYWVINDEHIVILKRPESPANQAQLMRNLSAVNIPGSRLEIIDRSGLFFGIWTKVFAYLDDGQIYAEGWILAETVKNAVRTEKGAFSP